MKFLTDVNIPLPLIKLLKKDGHEVQDARIDYPDVLTNLITIVSEDSADSYPLK